MNNKKIIRKVNKNCSSCGGNLVFSPQEQCLLCCKCGQRVQIIKSKTIEKHIYGRDDLFVSKNDWQDYDKLIKCANGGANIQLGCLEFSKDCEYCGSSNVVNSNVLSGHKPDGIIPFAFDKKEALNHFRNNIKKRFFIPNTIKKA